MNTNGRQEYFGIGVDNTQLRADAKEAKDHFKEIGNTAVTAGDTIDKSFGKSTEQLKKAIAEQKQLISDIKGDINNLSQQAKNPNNKDAAGDLGAAKKALAEEQATLLGLQRQKTEAAAAEVSGNSNIIASLSKWAIGLFSVTAAMGAAKKIMESTEATAHQWEIVTAEASAATSYFFKTIASGDWSGFFEGIGKAIVGAKEYVNMMEDLNNRKNEQIVAASKLDVLIGKEWEKSYASDLSARKSAFSEIIRLQKIKLGEEAIIKRDEFNVSLKHLAAINGVDAKALQNKIEYYRNNKKLLDDGERYNELKNKISIAKAANAAGGMSYNAQKGLSAKQIAELEAEQKAIVNGVAAAAAAIDWGKITEKERNDLAKSLGAAYSAEAAPDLANKRLNLRLAQTEKAMAAEAATKAKAAQDARNKSIKDQEEFTTEVGKRRIAAAFEIEQQLLDTEKDGAEKRAKQADLNYRKTLSDLDIRKAEMIKRQNELSGGINTKTGKATKTYNPNLPGADQSQIDQLAAGALMVRNAAEDDFNKKQLERDKKVFDELFDQYETLGNKRLELERKYYTDMKVLESGRTNENTRSVDLAKANRRKAFEADIQALQSEALKSTEFYQTLFGSFADRGFASLEAFAKKANSVLSGATQYKNDKGKSMVTLQMPELDPATGAMITKTVNITVEEYNRLIEKTKELNDAIKKENPFTAIIDGFGAVADAVAEKDVPAIGDAVASLGVAVKNAQAILQDWSQSLRAIMGTASGDVIDSTIKMAGGIADLGLGIGRIATGDVVGGIGQTLQGLAGIVSIFKEIEIADKKRQAEQIQAQLNEIEYQRLLRQRSHEYNENDRLLHLIINDTELLNKLIKDGFIPEGQSTQWTNMSTSLQNYNTDLEAETKVAAGLWDIITNNKFTKERPGIFKGTLEDTEAMRQALLGMTEADARTYLGALSATGKLTDSGEKFYQQWVKSGQSVDDLTNSMADLYANMQEMVMGSGFDTFLQSAMDGLIAAKGDVTNFADFTEDSIKTALVNAFKYKVLAAAIEPLFDELSKHMIDGTASDAYIKDWTARYNAAVSGTYDQYTKTLTDAGLSASDILNTRTGSTKGIATASQDSVDENNGRLTAIQGHTFQLVDLTKSIAASAVSSVNYLAGIKKDTARLEAIENSNNEIRTTLGDMSRNGIILRQ